MKKKMYIQPTVETSELRGGFVMNGTSSVVVNNGQDFIPD